jgi:hypothetical protein
MSRCAAQGTAPNEGTGAIREPCAVPCRGRAMRRRKSRTRMRPQWSRDRFPLGADFCCFPPGWSWRRRPQGLCSDFISLSRYRQPVSAPNTYGGSITREMAMAETHEPLRPSNIAGPSYRPSQQGGCTFAVRQCASGVGEGPHMSSWGDHRRRCRSRSGCPIHRRCVRC